MGLNSGLLSYFFSIFFLKMNKMWVLACQHFGECSARVKLELTDFTYYLLSLSQDSKSESLWAEKNHKFLTIVVCYPFYACERELPNLNNAKWPQRSPVDKNRVLKYSLGVICFSILYCLPTFWEYKVGFCDENTPIERYVVKVYGS